MEKNPISGEENKANQSQFGYFAAENAECGAEVLDV